MLTFYRYNPATNRFSAIPVFDLSLLAPFRLNLSRGAVLRKGGHQAHAQPVLPLLR
jgi:hypothetical protein